MTPKLNSERVDKRFWLGSALIHGVILVALIYLLAGDKIFRREARKLKPEVVRKDEELAQVIDQIRELAVDRLQSQLKLLQAGQERMANNFHTLNAHYQPFLENQVETAAIRLEQEGADTFTRMEELQAAIKQAEQEKEKGSDPLWRVFDKNRAQILAGQEEIRRAVLVGAADQQDLIALQDQVDAAQMEVFSLVSSSVSAQNALWSDAKQSAKLGESIPKVQTDLQKAEEDLRQLQEKSTELQKAAREAQAALDAKKKQSPDDKKGIDSAEKNVRRASKNLELTAGRIPRREKQIEQLKDRLAKYEAELQTIKSRPAELAATRDNSATQAGQKQAQALADQRVVYNRLLEHLKAEAAEPPQTDANEKEGQPSATTTEAS